MESRADFPDGLTTVVDSCIRIRLGSLIIWRNDKKFEDEDLILVETGASTGCGIQLLNFHEAAHENRLLSAFVRSHGMATHKHPV